MFIESIGSHLLGYAKILSPAVILCVFQELTEEGLPFLILFHIKEDTESLEQFQQEVARQLISEKGGCVCVCGILYLRV